MSHIWTIGMEVSGEQELAIKQAASTEGIDVGEWLLKVAMEKLGRPLESRVESREFPFMVVLSAAVEFVLCDFDELMKLVAFFGEPSSYHWMKWGKTRREVIAQHPELADMGQEVFDLREKEHFGNDVPWDEFTKLVQAKYEPRFGKTLTLKSVRGK